MKTATFNVLEHDCQLKGHFLLEASAGTGKTFSIENIVLRKILEDCELGSILAVTFTKAAAIDLKIRIRANLEKALTLLGLSEGIPEGFFQEFFSSQDLLKNAKKRIRQALASFEQAQIYTIHGFCLRILREYFFEANLGGVLKDESSFSEQDFLRVIRDFLRLELHPSLYCPEQLELLMGHEGSEKLVSRIKEEIARGRWKNTASYAELLEKFEAVSNRLKSCYDFSLVQEDLLKLNNARKPEKKALFIQNVGDFTEIFRSLSPDEGFRSLIKKESEIFDLKAKKGILLRYPDFLEVIKQELFPIVAEARHKTFILSRLIFHAQEFVLRYLKKEEKFRFDDLLENAYQAVQSPVFCEKVQNQYRVAVIDEFQDTDPLQWEIFNALFGRNWKGDLFLVGDPKQSIYGFRRADIYTYLKAGQIIDHSKHLSLKTNFRSQPALIECLNALFNHCQMLFRLPKENKELFYEQVETGGKILPMDFKDNKGAVHFFYIQKAKKDKAIEEQVFFPYVAEEILKLHQKLALPLSKFAILVSRHQQAEELRSFFLQLNIPCVLQKTKKIYETPAYRSMMDLLKAVLNPRNESHLKVILGSTLFGYDHTAILKLNDLNELSKMLALFKEFHLILAEKGFGDFYLKLLSTVLKEGEGTVLQKLLSRENGQEFYANFSQIAEELIDFQALNKASPESLADYLKQFEALDSSDAEFLKCRRDPNEEAVQILTIHSSKGLEYDIVFALGLADRSRRAIEPIYQGPEGFTPLLDPENHPGHRLYCEEMDEERMRQLYVAMTRAKYRLYLPVLFDAEKKELGPGKYSPMEIFMAKWSSVQALSSNFYERIPLLKEEDLLNFISSCAEESFSAENLSDRSFSLVKLAKKQESAIFPPKNLRIENPPLQMHSYSLLARRFHKYRKYVPQRTNSLPPHDWEVKEKNMHTLPTGNITGNLLHQLLQKIPLELAQEKLKVEAWLEGALPLNYANWKQVIAHLLYQTLNAKINETFALCEIEAAKTFREMEFLYPLEDKNLAGEFPLENGYLKGVIDFIFEHQGKYYIVDWKSNWLGPDVDSYGIDSLTEAMQENLYLLQAKIYTQALKSYLSMIQPLPFCDIFGGAYYIFLRGCENLHSRGAFFIAPSEVL